MVASDASLRAVLLYYFRNYISLYTTNCEGLSKTNARVPEQIGYYLTKQKVKNSHSGADFIHTRATVKKSGKEKSRG